MTLTSYVLSLLAISSALAFAPQALDRQMTPCNKCISYLSYVRMIWGDQAWRLSQSDPSVSNAAKDACGMYESEGDGTACKYFGEAIGEVIEKWMQKTHSYFKPSEACKYFRMCPV
ncbi:hypothetical protein KIN20_007375 [Parelaphostrongylus tenuis]|uniref:Saposin B-type domain-containing protein n=1 Tax=Parelaphostrongylus tenuis TaxID=148309 RepID=A0AAD5M6G6_PARTN|nr:hypothetical protein KIN20_007375 [Parelaphostrongylus tenuis]